MPVPTNQSVAEWRVLCPDDLRSDIEVLLDEIGQALRNAPVSGDLASGSAGLAIFYAYMGFAQPGKGWEEDAERHLDQAISSLSEGVKSTHLYGGVAGIAWTAEHLQRRIPGLGEEDLNEEVDEVLERLLAVELWRQSYDLISGLVGYGVYACERIHRPSGRRIFARVLAHLDQIKTARDGGWAWHTDPRLLPSWQREDHPDGYFNLGVAHGVPGVIAFLGHAMTQGLEPERTKKLITGAVQWLMAQQEQLESLNSFAPLAYSLAPLPAPSRVAWCYGDLGLSVALLSAARSLQCMEWEQDALRIALKAAARQSSASGVIDGGLCHGSAGNTHLFNRLWQATGEEVFREASVHWLRRTLAFQTPGVGIAGFRAWSGATPGSLEPSWCDAAGFLEGAAGIGLSLLSAIYPVEPCWDRLLLASIPPPSSKRE